MINFDVKGAHYLLNDHRIMPDLISPKINTAFPHQYGGYGSDNYKHRRQLFNYAEKVLKVYRGKLEPLKLEPTKRSGVSEEESFKIIHLVQEAVEEHVNKIEHALKAYKN